MTEFKSFVTSPLDKISKSMYGRNMQEINTLKQRLREITHLRSALAILQWDQEVYMPEEGSGFRGETLAYLAGLNHTKFIALDNDGLLSKLHQAVQAGEIVGDDAVIVEEVWRDFEREQKLPTEFVEALAKLTSEANSVWIKARKANDFALFAPYLERIVAMSREQAKLIGYNDSPYDALLNMYEPGATTSEVATTLEMLKTFLVPFIQKLKTSADQPDASLLLGTYPIDKQVDFNKHVAETLGFNFSCGRVDVSAHPFCTNFNPYDVRFTTRYNIEDIWGSVGSTVHEVGHGLYEQGLQAEHFGTPLAEYISLGIHESQSRMWENQVGKSKPFWQFFYPKLQAEFPEPFTSIELEDFYRAINSVMPSLIRTESDEVTYNLHIIIRFEIEKELIEGTLEVKDVPQVWNRKYKEYLGIEVPNDAQGVLQDVHWSHGSFGYFPTYTLGNLYAAQLFTQAKKEIPDLETKFARGEFAPLLVWLREKIHIHGKRFTAGALIEEITGKPLSSTYFTAYLEEKYTEIYQKKENRHE